MAVVPRNVPDMIRWYQQRQADWTTNQAAIGLSASDNTTLATKLAAAVAALDADEAAKTASKNATVALHDAARPLAAFGAECIQKIRAKAGQDGNDQPYVLASVPPPATPAPKAPPGKPTDLVVTLSELGDVNLKWKCPNPPGTSGTIYQIWRRIGTESTATYLAGAGKKEFTDSTLPAGSTNVVYQIQASRSTKNGPWATFNVQFGIGGAGAMTASVTETNGPKIAA